MELWINGKNELVLGLAPEKSTITDLLKVQGWRQDGIAVELNENVVPKKDHSATVLHAGDKIEVVTLIGGG